VSTAPGADAEPVEPSTGGAESHQTDADTRTDAEPAGSVELEAAPPVVVVVVAADPGPWWEDSLASIGAQAYDAVSVLIVDNASAEPVEARAARVLPGAAVVRLDEAVGYGEACNQALHAVEGAAFYLFCHDDVRLEADVVSFLVGESFRSNAGIVGPKLVAWDDPGILLQVGMGADKYGQPAPTAEWGELDQQQHDAVREVFTVPGGATLVRADLFAVLGGFDPAITFVGEDVDLCWRAHVAGARVVVAPQARVAHRGDLASRRPGDSRRRLATRHHLRSQLVCYRRMHRWRVLPQAAAATLVEALWALVAGRLGHSVDVLAAWPWNLRRVGDVRRRRKALGAVRQVPDREVRALQVRGNARFTAFLRTQREANDDRLGEMAGRADEGVGATPSRLRAAPARLSLVVWIVLGLLVVLGSRELITGDVPVVGRFVELESPGDALSTWLSGYREVGLGGESAAPTSLAVLAGFGSVLLGNTDLARQVLILGMLPLGMAGLWRVTRAVGSRRARLVSLAVYVFNPVPYNALSQGRWAGLIAYGLAPWLVNQLVRSTRLAPFGPTGGRAGPGATDRPLFQRLLLVGFLTAFFALLVPAAPVLVVGAALALLVGGWLTLQFRGTWRLLVVGVVGAGIAAVLQLPWTLALVDPETYKGAAAYGYVDLDLGSILRFDTGFLGGGALSWLFLPVAVLPLLIGRDWRLAWAARGWALALAAWGVVFATAQGWVPAPLPDPEVVLSFGAVGVALAAGMAMASFEVDLPDYRFGWRQIASVLAGLATLAFAIPFLGAAAGGRWDVPEGDFATTLRFMDDDQQAGPFRVLWVGDPDLLPVQAWRVGNYRVEQSQAETVLGYATVDGTEPGVAYLAPSPEDETTEQLQSAIEAALAGDTSRMGAVLAPMGVRYVVVPTRLAPAPYTDVDRSRPDALLGALDGQLDLSRVETFAGIVAYRNGAWGPSRATLPADAVLPGGDVPLGERVIPELEGAPPALADDEGFADYIGSLAPSSQVYQAAAGGRWQLEVGGVTFERTPALGWAGSFPVDAAGDGRLTYDTPVQRWLELGAQALVWVIGIVYLLRTRVVRAEARDAAQTREQHDL
jgi:GT2 family glycosyltransferase